LVLPDSDYEFFVPYHDTLKEIFIVSCVNLKRGEFAVNIIKAHGKKCARCWNWREDVGLSESYPETCSRCGDAIKNREIKR